MISTAGARASVIAAVGCTLGIIPHIVAAITGLAALLNASARAFETLKFLGVAYLLYMAWAMWNEKGAVTFNQEAAPRSALRVIGSGILINILNPKLTIFFFAFLPQFREHQRAACPATNAGAECRLMLVTLVVFVVYGVFAASVRNQVVSRPRVTSWMRRVFAGSFVALSARLALTDR